MWNKYYRDWSFLANQMIQLVSYTYNNASIGSNLKCKLVFPDSYVLNQMQGSQRRKCSFNEFNFLFRNAMSQFANRIFSNRFELEFYWIRAKKHITIVYWKFFDVNRRTLSYYDNRKEFVDYKISFEWLLMFQTHSFSFCSNHSKQLFNKQCLSICCIMETGLIGYLYVGIFNIH